ncbi:MAG: hypothetical protein ACREJV_11140 [Candidatus Rokuibacteriota bacterium]
MLIGRCAWHPRYRGYPRWHGVTSWRGWRLRFTDGICPRCLDRLLREYRERLAVRASETAGGVSTAA